MTGQATDTPQPPLTLRAALRGIWEADKYSIRGNEDWRAATRLDAEALEKAATAMPGPEERPEFARSITALRGPHVPNDVREEIMSALYDLFDPKDNGEGKGDTSRLP